MKQFLLLAALILTLCSQELNAQDAGTKSEKTTETKNKEFKVTVEKVRDSIFMLKGKGGNIGLCIGKDGAFLIDNQLAGATPEILNTVSNLTMNPVQFLINTHHHNDHTGGNKNMREAGIVIFAHENVRKRILGELEKKYADSINKIYEDRLASYSGDDLNSEKSEERVKQSIIESQNEFTVDEKIFPMITFNEDLTFHYNDETIRVFHVHNAHTDGDAMVYFAKSNVLHTGDVFGKDRYPFIDINNGGSLAGYMEALSRIIVIANEDTKIIPGHGDVSTVKDVKYIQSMIEFVSKRIAYHRVDNKSLDQVLLMTDITKEFDDKGFGDAFISREEFITMLYEDAMRKFSVKKDDK